MSYTKGYKAFNKGLVCRGHRFKVGEEYEVEGKLEMCKNGFHFCKDLVLTLDYYPNLENNSYCEVEAIGEVIYEEPTKHKACTSKIRIIKLVTKKEIKKLLDKKSNSGDSNSGDSNSGDSNSGNSNSGYSNSGDSNSGNRNSGDRNSGYRNSGDSNSGNRNSGYRNSGDSNSGDSNSGDSNSGDSNSGDWNSCDRETGFLNSTQGDTVNVFNKPTKRSEWNNSIKPDFLYFHQKERESYKEAFIRSYNECQNKEKQTKQLKGLPNFDSGVFFEISGIKID